MATTVKKTATTAKPRKAVAKKDEAATVAKVGKVAKPVGKKAGPPAKTAAKPRKAATKRTKTAEIAEPMKLVPPSREQIEQLAREYWAERGYQDGLAEQDWLRAEHDLQQKAS